MVNGGHWVPGAMNVAPTPGTFHPFGRLAGALRLSRPSLLSSSRKRGSTPAIQWIPTFVGMTDCVEVPGAMNVAPTAGTFHPFCQQAGALRLSCSSLLSSSRKRGSTPWKNQPSPILRPCHSCESGNPAHKWRQIEFSKDSRSHNHPTIHLKFGV